MSIFTGEYSAATCEVCPRRCGIAPGALGACRARRNVGGVVVPENYGRVTSLALDPVEKKPLARWRPGSYVVSVGSYGCNLACPFCQNHQISQHGQKDVPWRELSPEGLVALIADAAARDPRVVGVAFTYNEPLVGWESVRDASRLAHERGLATVLASNGCADQRVIDGLAPLVDAANIDLKSLSPEFYEACGAPEGALDAVRATIEQLAAEPGCYLEVTTLVVPGMNDSEDGMDGIAGWLADLNGGRGADELTLHITRFFGRWRMADAAPTPPETVYRLADVARRHLSHAFVGNC